MSLLLKSSPHWPRPRLSTSASAPRPSSRNASCRWPPRTRWRLPQSSTAARAGFRISVTIVDSGGQIRLFTRTTVPGSCTPSMRASARPTPHAPTAFERRVHEAHRWPGRTGPAAINNTIGVAGGLPIKIGEETIGGIGIAGAPGRRRRACAAAGSRASGSVEIESESARDDQSPGTMPGASPARQRAELWIVSRRDPAERAADRCG